MRGQHRQMSETFFLGVLLALTGGFLDAYTYLARGGVFANAQTGNIVLLGLSLARGDGGRALYYTVPIAAFIVGVIAAECVRTRFKDHPRVHWRQIVLALETVILAAVAFFPSKRWDVAANVAVSFICSMQTESFRKLDGNVYATTMCTGNLRSATEACYRFFQTREPQQRRRSIAYYGIILFFIVGAALGAWWTGLFGEKAILLCCLPLAVGFAAMFYRAKAGQSA